MNIHLGDLVLARRDAPGTTGAGGLDDALRLNIEPAFCSRQMKRSPRDSVALFPDQSFIHVNSSGLVNLLDAGG